MVLVKECDA
jgi:hypothetical protein